MNRRELLKQMAWLGVGTLMGSVADAVLAGAELHKQPRVAVFTENQRALMAQLTERIIPTTDTPGAMSAGVPVFVERMVSEWYTATERRIFIEGLSAFDMFCQQQFQASALTCNGQQLDTALLHFEKLENQYRNLSPKGALAFSDIPDENAPFFKKLKELTVVGYYTSAVGAQQELRYDPMPMSYDGDVDFGPADRAWSSGAQIR